MPGNRNNQGTITELRPGCSLPLPKLPGQGDAEKGGAKSPPRPPNNTNVEVLRGAPTPLQASPRPTQIGPRCQGTGATKEAEPN